MGQKGIPDALTRTSDGRGLLALSPDDVFRALEGCQLTSKDKAARSSETPHPIKCRGPHPHMTFIIRQHCHSQQEN